MVPATQHQHQQQQQQELMQKQLPATSSIEEEALKRNTDCVYFLASPLTCKKGTECEYRHSEYARVNPRDCYYWLHGNCLNPKCGFRHPPLDGLLGSQGGPSVGSFHPQPPNASAPPRHGSYNSAKQGVPCIFFQKGICFKGDWCTFSHSTGGKSQQPTDASAAKESQSSKKTLGGVERSSQNQKIAAMNLPKASEKLVEAKGPPKVQNAPQRNGSIIEGRLPQAMDAEYVPQPLNVRSVSEVSNTARSTHLIQPHVAEDLSFPNGKDADDNLRESSPGFDVLVDNELGDSDYYCVEDQYGRSQEGRITVNEYDPSHPADFDGIVERDQELFHDPQLFDSYDYMSGPYAWGQRRSSERVSSRPTDWEGKHHSRSPEYIEGMDLRYRLSKQRRVNGLRSVVSNDYISSRVEERNVRGPRRDLRQLPPQEGSITSRLQGRLKLPERPLPNSTDSNPERGLELGRYRRQLSPGRTQQGRLRDRIKGRVEESYNDQMGRFWFQRLRRDADNDQGMDFAAPKSLAQLKAGKDPEIKEQLSLRKRKNLEDNQISETNAAFDGPLPLSEILKRKRQATVIASSKGGASENHKEEAYQVRKDEEQRVPGTEGNKDDLETSSGNVGEITEAKNAAGVVQAGVKHDTSADPDNNQMMGAEFEHEGDGEDHKYEQEGDDGAEHYEEGGEEEYLEDDDGDDFAKKIGVMFS